MKGCACRGSAGAIPLRTIKSLKRVTRESGLDFRMVDLTWFHLTRSGLSCGGCSSPPSSGSHNYLDEDPSGATFGRNKRVLCAAISRAVDEPCHLPD